MKKIGFVSYWFNRGQAVVTRYVKSIFDEAGYETFVLVRRGRLANLEGDWKDKNVTVGHLDYDMPIDIYKDWAHKNELDVCFFDQNYQFDAIKSIKDMGIKTVGRFVWEQFSREHAAPAKESLDIIYSLTNAEKKRYSNKIGIDSPLIRWGIHPSINDSYHIKNNDFNWFYFPAGYCNDRKNITKVIQAFKAVKNKNNRLLITSQKDLGNLKDNRIKVLVGNIETHEKFHKIMSKCHVCLIPSKWEGLGLSFMEAIAFDMPIITTNFPPMNEYLIENETGLLVACDTSSRLKNGLKIADINVKSLSKSIEILSESSTIKRMSEKTKLLKYEYSWENTRNDYLSLVEEL